MSDVSNWSAPTKEALVKSIVEIEELLEDVRLGKKPMTEAEQHGLRNDLEALKDQMILKDGRSERSN